MAFDFPASPTNGQVYTSGGKSYAWNGVAWDPQGSTYVAKSGDSMSGRLGIGASIPTESWLHVRKGSAGTPPAWTASDVALLENTAGSNVVLQFLTSNAAVSAVNFSDTDARGRGAFTYAHATDMLSVTAGGANVLNATATSLGTPLTTASTSPTTGALTVAGGVGIGGAAYASAFNLAAGGGVANLADYTVLVDKSGGNSLIIGNTTQPNNFFRNTSHSFESRDALVRFAFMDATKVNIPLATTSNSPTTGALTVAGGVGVSGQLTVGTGVVVDVPSYPALTLKIGGATKWSVVTADGSSLLIHNAGATAGVQLATQSATAWSAYSDISLKQNLQSLSVRERMQAGDYRFASFDWKYDGHHDVGVVAQNFATVFPEWVDDIDGKLAVQEAKAGLAALAYTQELDDELTLLREELATLRARVAQLEGER